MEIPNSKIYKQIDQMYGKSLNSYNNKIGEVQLQDSNNSKKVISNKEQELSVFLYTMFQYYLEKANELNSSEEQEKKEKSIKILTSLIDSSFIKHFKSNKIIFSCLNGILNFYLGNFTLSNEDQTIAENYFNKSVDFFNTLPTIIKIRYINIYQEIFNNLGIIYYNKGDIKRGLQNLGKAEQMYKIFNDLNGINYTNDFKKFMKSCCNNNNMSENEIDFFNFYIDGGLNKRNFEHNYTLTIFYYAQAFTKQGFRKKAIKYCSLTLKRQIESNKCDLKDALINCINLSDFYIENQNYAQAEYLLISAMTLLPEDQTKKKKLRAALQNQLGKYFLERLRFAVIRMNEQVFISDNEELSSTVNKKIFTFNTLSIVWPKIEDITNLEQAKTLFRLSNTQFKKALNFYVLDGYVTEHIEITRNQSSLYNLLIRFENDNNRIFAMEERRINLLTPIYNAINHKVFVMQWQEISLELAEIYLEIFESNYELIRAKKKKIANSKEIEEINEKGEMSIKYYKDIIEYIETEYNKEKESEKKVDEFLTIITIKSNLARIYSKLIYNKDIKKRVDALKTSLNMYKEVRELLKNAQQFYNEKPELQENLLMCEEMIGMLPIKIDKINRGEEF
jgi:hypothetical protein